MSEKTFLRVVGVIFLLVAVVHLLRLVFKCEVVLAGWPAPVEVISSPVKLVPTNAHVFTDTVSPGRKVGYPEK